ncbi:MAG: lipoprotein insertase outer membrane protein LolB [Woeseiaceae bacterium]|nr:lipoprotein insertase outer membrane protein LolB [Woeseiaceae bacterium]
MPKRLRNALCVPFIALLFACAGPRSVELPELGDWESRRNILGGVDEWEFAGRIAVSAGTEGFNGQIRWRQDGVVYRARLHGPLGAGTVFLNGDDRELTLTDRNGSVTELTDAEADIRRLYGWTIPVTSLRFWALGIPDPRLPAETGFDADGYLARLQQANWQVDFKEYREGGGQQLPRRLTAVNDDVRVRLVIDAWQFR